ncbi:VOC family protein [Georgenia subflava]|uniref:VOC family protein n=1 Tax=Georgenia subflava TaxID=1622177 RepID=A0A6N7EGM0_9MICO|nr:VOC family protein [Georgenia subflava]MPV36118.1 VOC family protein [Georgenia subflava]
MPARLSPYLGFRDNARAAMEFYQSVLGGTLDVSTFSEFQASEDPAEADKVMHSQLETDNGMTLMASDTPSGMEYSEGGSHSVAIFGDDEAELRGYWDKLSDGGTVTMPYEKAPWGDTFGMLVDKFGITWMINAAGQQQ